MLYNQNKQDTGVVGIFLVTHCQQCQFVSVWGTWFPPFARLFITEMAVMFLLLTAMMAAVAAKDCQTFNGIELGSDFIANFANVGDAGLCCSMCQANASCIAFTYALDDKNCYLKVQ
jgi:hypothetical protein